MTDEQLKAKYPMALYWDGEPIDTLSKDRLIEIIAALAKQQDDERAREYERMRILFKRMAA